jgi:membrane-bound serine protease (ClpP class)
MIAYILLFLGLLFIWLEFYLPGGALAVAGAISLFAGCIFYVAQSDSVIESLLFFTATCVSTIVVIRFAIRGIKKSGEKNTFFLSQDQEGYKAAAFQTSLVGKKGVTLTEFGPSGYILIDGVRYPAICRGPYLEKGCEVEVVAGESGHLIVKPVVL